MLRLIKDDIFQSRGILNLIPNKFFNENKTRVEDLIKTIKD